MKKIWQLSLIVFILVFLIGVNSVSAATWTDYRVYIGNWIYDDTNNSVVDSQWTQYTSGNGYHIGEDTDKMEINVTGLNTQSGTAGVYTNKFVNVSQITNMTLYLTIGGTIPATTGTGGDAMSYLNVFGKQVYAQGCSGSGPCSAFDTSVWTIVKNQTAGSNKFDVFNDGVLDEQVTATSNIINISASAYAPGAGLTGNLAEVLIYSINYSGENVFLPTPNGTVILNSPANNSQYLNGNSVNFNCTTNLSGTADLVNISLFLNGVLNDTTLITGKTNGSIFTKTLWGDYNWTCQACDSDGDCGTSSETRILLGRNVAENSQTYNSTTYETASETFTINVSANSSLTAANLIYGGTSYEGTNIGGGVWSRTIDIPLGSSNKVFYWNFTYAGTQISSTSHTQTVNYSNLYLCNATYNVPFINFTFADESTSLAINASVDLATFDYWIGSGSITKEYIFQNNTANPMYSFCFSPSDKTLNIDLSFKYSNSSYPQRTFVYDNKILTNTTTTKILYLLGSSDGIYSTIQFLDAGTNAPISSVAVTAEREILGTWTLVAQGLTDAAGSITFWVNPDYEHRITATKTGYASVSETITPTQSSYTIFMGTSANVSIPGYRYKNLRYFTYPGAGRLEPNTIYTFGFNVTSTDGNLISCKIEIRNLSSSVVATSSVGCGASGGVVSVNYNVGTDSKLFGYYYVDIGNGLELFKANDAWFVEYMNVSSSGGLKDFFQSLGDLTEWGNTHNRQEFSKVVFFFFMMIITIGIFTFFSGYELSSPGSALILVWGFIAFGSVSGIIKIEGLSPYAWWNQYGIFMIVSFLFFGFILNTMRREAS